MPNMCKEIINDKLKLSLSQFEASRIWIQIESMLWKIWESSDENGGNWVTDWAISAHRVIK